MIDIILPVLDALVQSFIVILFVLIVILLALLVWDVAHVDPDEGVMVPVDRLTPKQRASIEMAQGMGFQTTFDYARYGGDLKDRLGECYMLAAKAMLFSRDSTHGLMPLPSAVIHGSWHGPTSESRIDHAIVLLDTGDIWEPVTAGIYRRIEFEAYTRWQRHQIYSAAEARKSMATTGHYGPWS